MNIMCIQDINVLKGIAIIAVVLFHLGFFKSGYLGVDLFFVIKRFFVISSVIRQIGNNTFSYISFLEKKLARFGCFSFGCFLRIGVFLDVARLL